MRYNANQLAPVRPLMQVAGAHLLQQASCPYGARRQSAGACCTSESPVPETHSRCGNPCIVGLGLVQEFLVAVSATSKCRGLIPRLLFYLGFFIGVRPEHIRRRERRPWRNSALLLAHARDPRPGRLHIRQSCALRGIPPQVRSAEHTVSFRASAKRSWTLPRNVP